MKQLSIILSFLFLCLSITAQDLNQGKKLYLEGKYEEALPIFEEEYAKKPTDASINHWLGVCLFQTKKDLDRAETFLKFASTKKIRDSYYYLSLINAENLQAETALSNLALYQKELTRTYGKTKAQQAEDKTLLEESKTLQTEIENLQRMILHTEDVVIIDSLIVKKEDLLNAYHLSPLIGELSYAGEVFKLDNIENAYTTVFFTENRAKAYFSMPDSIGIHNIYSMDRLSDGTYGNRKPLFPDRFDFEGDMKYPYVLSDGMTIIFASQENPNVGGLSLYITRFNTTTNKYLKPEKLNSPFNSFSNDFLYVIDDFKQIGWFATDRNVIDGYVTVYTFIPNTDHKMIDSDDANYLSQRAQISSIKETWEADKEYTSLIALAKEDIPAVQQIKKDFTFVVQGNNTYYTLADFKSNKAKELYKQVIGLNKRLTHLTTTLDTQREMIANQKKPSMEQREILVMENEALALSAQIYDLENKVRAIETNN